MSTIPLDLETIPEQPEKETIAAITETITHPAKISAQKTIDEWNAGTGKYEGAKEAAIQKAYRDTSFDGSKGQICSIGWAPSMHHEPISIFATPGKISEADMLSNFFDDVRKYINGRYVYFAGHFVGGFDLPFLFHRSVINGVDPGMDLGQHGRHGQDFFDTMVEWAGWKGSISQDNLCKAMGIVIDEPAEIEGLDGSTVWDFYKAGKYDEIGIYNRVDIKKVQAMHKRMMFA